ncbi:four helix bundle protein [Candidatus Woesearchaeota archaeon]|nr:four helix bundle protein [Nanoarchaeota archaeon]MCB9370467.1 four helix bundle protein [Candidatus Woesearchaeota archaeon]USN43546.1 MAG: four helix bundle protein [Candidatus Woesearchaeota archaeon]
MENNCGKKDDGFLLYHEVYNLYLNLYPSLARFPKSEKFTLRQSIDETALEMLIILDKFTRLNQKDKSSQLRKISYLFDKFKLLLRIAKDLHFLPFNQYLLMLEKSELLGKLLGGLLKKYTSNLY